MELAPYRLGQWFRAHGDSIAHHLGASTGPTWTLPELRALMTDAERDAFDGASLTYCPANGREPLRAALASFYGADPEEILILVGGAEALLAVFFVASRPGSNVVVPSPSFAPFVELPRSLGIETRCYSLPAERGFALDVDAVTRLVDERTTLILLNAPHNPTGALIEEAAIRELDAFAARRGIHLVVDEVYHPIYHGAAARSAGAYSNASVLGDFSKSFSLPGLRVGWLLERDPRRREALESAHGYFVVSGSMLSELLAEVAARNRETLWDRTRNVSDGNLALLDAWCAEHRERVEWERPRGGMTAFPRLRDAASARPFCREAARRGVLLAPGDCFGAPAHFRIGFGLEMPRYGRALDILGDVLRSAAL